MFVLNSKRAVSSCLSVCNTVVLTEISSCCLSHVYSERLIFLIACYFILLIFIFPCHFLFCFHQIDIDKEKWKNYSGVDMKLDILTRAVGSCPLTI